MRNIPKAVGSGECREKPRNSSTHLTLNEIVDIGNGEETKFLKSLTGGETNKKG